MPSDLTRSRSRWKLMIRRCEDPNMLPYPYYGGRGIKVCEQWHDFDVYHADIMRLIGPCPEGMSLDRIDNDGNYEPGNVRWATASQQQRNSRNVLRTAARGGSEMARDPKPGDQYLTIQEAMDRLKISRETLTKLIRNGELHAFKVGSDKQSHLRVTEASILAFVKRHTVPVTRNAS